MTDARNALILASVAREQEWAYNARIVAGLSWHAIRGLALRPIEAGGINRNVGVGTLKELVAAYRAAQGEVVGTAEERRERRQLEYDELALAARKAIARADEVDALDVHAVKILLDVRAAEAKMHGDDKPVEAKVEITTRDAIDVAVEEMLARLDGVEA